MSVPDDLIELCSLSPSFSPTPMSSCPPDGLILHQELNNFKRRLAWQVFFRKKDLKDHNSIEEFVNQEIKLFVKDPWYTPSSREPPSLPPALEFAFETVYRNVMDPSNWTEFKPNLSPNLRKSVKCSKNLPTSNVGIYLQDKSSRICFANLAKTNDKVEKILSDTSKYEKLGVEDPGINSRETSQTGY